jgi:hypothetical protein
MPGRVRGSVLTCAGFGEAGEGEIVAHRRMHEDVDLSAAVPEIAARLRRELAADRERVNRGVAETAQPLGERDRERLRALGYLESRAPR